MSGPYATEHEAVMDARDVITGPPRSYRELNEAKLYEALRDAGVEAGAYDERVLCWLAGWEPQVVHAIAGWIQRAHDAGAEEVLAEDGG